MYSATFNNLFFNLEDFDKEVEFIQLDDKDDGLIFIKFNFKDDKRNFTISFDRKEEAKQVFDGIIETLTL